jgi:hypothetical protein
MNSNLIGSGVRLGLCIALMMGLAAGASAINEGTRTYSVNYTDSPPAIDGVVGPTEWSDADPASGGFELLRTGPPADPAVENISFQAMFDGLNLYVLITTDHTDYSAAGGSDDDSITFSDTFGLFWCPGVDDNQGGDDEEDSYQIELPGISGVRAPEAPGPPFAITAARYDALFGGTGWNPTGLAIGITADLSGGVVELAIPFIQMTPSFGVPTDSGDGETDLTVGTFPGDGDQWQFNVTRNVSTGPSPNLPIWNWHAAETAPGFFAERPHGTITFVGGPPVSSIGGWEFYQ